jgi:hypothetical protein
MYCLHCGDCCLRMSPINGGECPYIIIEGKYHFCSYYKNRPKECVNHDFPARFCPIGMSKLGLHDIDSIRIHIDTAYEILKSKGV